MNALLESEAVRRLLDVAPRAVVADAIRSELATVRADGNVGERDHDTWAVHVAERVAIMQRPHLRRVINGSGIVLHTNLGRAPLATSAIDAMMSIAAGYSNLELDLDTGSRGSRYSHCAALLRELTGAEDALVVNNGTAALVLSLNSCCDAREAILSRGELVEIGGSFRVHEIMAKSGAILREVGATNRTHLADYSRALNADTGALLKIHRSNFTMHGFTADVACSDLTPLAREHNVPIIHDLGSGLLIPLDSIGLTGEPTATQALAAGAAIVTMSGDKLLGGPQCGIILGTSESIATMRANPLARSYRVDKITLAALEATLALYRDPLTALREIPTLAMLGTSATALRERAEEVLARLDARQIEATLVQTVSRVGAGAFPAAELPSWSLALAGNAHRWASALRNSATPLIGRISGDRFHVDFRAIATDEVTAVADAIIAALD